MTKIIIYKNEKKECVGFRTSGHAGYADAGEDIVCAAISILTINTMNAIEILTSNQASMISDEEEGFIDYRISGTPTKEATLLLKAMILGLRDLADNEDYENYIDLTFEEV